MFLDTKESLGGQMNDGSGWYLPFLYLDVYVDIYGRDSIDEAVDQVISGNFDMDACRGLEMLYDQCKAEGETLKNNKCFQKFDGSYVDDFQSLKNDIKAGKTLTFFGFSEKSAEIQRDTGAVPYGVTSWPFSANADCSYNAGHSYMLQFTDALVVSKKAWYEAGDEKKNAIRKFIDYFTGVKLRRKIALGVDLNPIQNRYLLQAIDTFYASVPEDPVYSSAYRNLLRSAAAPYLSDQQKADMQRVLEEAIENGCDRCD